MNSRYLALALYDDEVSRSAAVAAVDQLFSRSQGDFDMQWCSLKEMDQCPDETGSAAAAARADLLIVALSPLGLVTHSMRDWFGKFIRLRQGREGAVFGLLDPCGTKPSEKYRFLREMSHQAGMDYLTQLPRDWSLHPATSPKSNTRRSEEITSVLDGILRRSPPPPQKVY